MRDRRQWALNGTLLQNIEENQPQDIRAFRTLFSTTKMKEKIVFVWSLVLSSNTQREIFQMVLLTPHPMYCYPLLLSWVSLLLSPRLHLPISLSREVNCRGWIAPNWRGGRGQRNHPHRGIFTSHWPGTMQRELDVFQEALIASGMNSWRSLFVLNPGSAIAVLIHHCLCGWEEKES